MFQLATSLSDLCHANARENWSQLNLAIQDGFSEWLCTIGVVPKMLAC